MAIDPEERPLSDELAVQVYSRQLTAILVNLLLSALTVLVLWPLHPGFGLPLWFGAILLGTVVRFALGQWFKRSSGRALPAERWLRFYSVAAIVNAICWGASPVIFFSARSPQMNIFIAFVIGGLVAGAAGTLASLNITMRLFTAVVCLPMIIRYLVVGDRLHVVMGIMMTIYAAAYLAMSSTFGRMIITSLKLRYENLREIDERKKAEAELRLIKDGLEETVSRRAGELKRANKELSREVAERRLAEERLNESEKRYRNLVESSSDWIWEVDRDGVYTYSSPSVELMLGYTVEEILGKTFFDLMPPGEAERILAEFRDKRDNGLPFVRLVNTVLHRDGSERILETNGEPVFDGEGGLIGYRGIDRDITHRVRHEEAARKIEHLKSLGSLAGGIAHDFNNLLTSIFGNIDLARMRAGGESPVSNCLEESAKSLEEARKLTTQLLTFARGGSPIRETTSIRDLILDTCRFVLSGSAIKSEPVVPEDLWTADVDPSQIWHVLSNILTNAREAMPEGGLIRVVAENVAVSGDDALPLLPGDYVRISVADQGHGISATDLHRVFDPYFSTKERGAEKGTGIGLAICHSVIEKHQGHIELSSSPEEGTTVTFLLPAKQGEAAGRPATEPAGTPAPLCCRVLLLEDDESVINTTTRILQHLGHTVEVARHGVEAIEAQSRARDRKEPFDLLLLDLTIRGGMGGREAVGMLKSIDPTALAVVISGYADSPVLANYREHGFDGSLIKPFSIVTLRNLIADLLGDPTTGAGPVQ